MDLKNLSMDTFTAIELVSLLSDCDVVLAEWPEGIGDRDILKGRELLQGVISTGENVQARYALLQVANTTQFEMVLAALHLIDKGKMSDTAINTLTKMLVSVSRRGELH